MDEGGFSSFQSLRVLESRSLWHVRFSGPGLTAKGLRFETGLKGAVFLSFFLLGNYDDLYHWSVRSYSDFWAEFWKFSGIVHSRMYDEVSGSGHTRVPSHVCF